MFYIPTANSSWGSVDVSLEGSVYTFEYSYNSRNGKFYLSVSKAGELIISNVQLTTDSTAIGEYVNDKLPQGWLMLFPQLITNEPISPDNFGLDQEYELLYITSEEVQEYLTLI